MKTLIQEIGWPYGGPGNQQTKESFVVALENIDSNTFLLYNAV
jgi:hypothetical protein